MAKGEIVIDENRCKGCSYCIHFCNLNCIVMPGDIFTPKGYSLPVFINTDECTGCGICGWMCPDQAIEVYRYVEAESR